MPRPYAPLERVERLIAFGRSIMAGTALIAYWLDPATSGELLIPVLLRAYLVYSVAVAIVMIGRGPLPVVPLLTHVADVLVFTVLIVVAGGAMSPFFVYFVFALITATLRWKWRGTLWTGLAVLVVFTALALHHWRADSANFETNRVVIRGVYLAVAALLIGYLGAHQERLQRDLSRLAAWSGHPPRDVEAAAREVLERTVAISRAQRALLVWEEAEEPWVNVAEFGRSLRVERGAPDLIEQLVPVEIADRSFLCEDAAASSPVVVCGEGESFVRWYGSPLSDDFRTRYRIRSVFSAPVEGDDFRGRLFLVGLPSASTDDLHLGEILAQHASSHLNQAYLIQRLRDAAATDERVRLARDLHDGVLQSLTASALQLEAAGQLVERDPGQARERLSDIGRIIAAEQAELRGFISELRPRGTGAAPSVTFLRRVEQLTERLAQHWQIRVETQIGALPQEPTGRLALELYRLIHEAIVNAARHARASSITLELTGDSRALRLVVSDDGEGFPFKGEFDLHLLARQGRGPVSLIERITSLGGQLRLRSTDSGSRLEFDIPLERRRRSDVEHPRSTVLTFGDGRARESLT